MACLHAQAWNAHWCVNRGLPPWLGLASMQHAAASSDQSRACRNRSEQASAVPGSLTVCLRVCSQITPGNSFCGTIDSTLATSPPNGEGERIGNRFNPEPESKNSNGGYDLGDCPEGEALLCCSSCILWLAQSMQGPPAAMHGALSSTRQVMRSCHSSIAVNRTHMSSAALVPVLQMAPLCMPSHGFPCHRRILLSRSPPVPISVHMWTAQHRVLPAELGTSSLAQKHLPKHSHPAPPHKTDPLDDDLSFQV